MKTLRATATVLLLTTALLLNGCAERTPAPGMDTSSEFSESNSEYSTEHSEMSIADSSLENISEGSTSGDDEYWSYETEIYLDQQYLETVKKDRLHVRVVLRMDEGVIQEEFNEIYPDNVEPIYWSRFLSNRGEQIVRDFMPDYSIDYEDFVVFRMGALFSGVLDKNTVSLMLNDPRVAEIVYYPAGFPVFSTAAFFN